MGYMNLSLLRPNLILSRFSVIIMSFVLDRYGIAMDYMNVIRLRPNLIFASLQHVCVSVVGS